MLEIDIPAYKKLILKHLVLDYNGTLAIDGKLIEGVKEKLNILSEQLQVHVITADTFGEAALGLKGVNCSLKIIEGAMQIEQKLAYIENLGITSVVAIGNGINDCKMLESACLGIALIQQEGAALKTVLSADIVCTNILDALALLLNPMRIIATLRL